MSRISLPRACASSNKARSRLHRPTKAFLAPRFSSEALISACICETSSRSRSLDRPIRVSFSMRLCTTRSACSLVVHSSNSAVSSSTRLSIRRTLALLLPRMPRSSSICSASCRRESPSRRATWFSTSLTASVTTRCMTWRRCGSSCVDSASSSATSRLAASPCASPAMRAARAWRADSGKTRSAPISSVRAVSRRCRSICCATCSAVASGSTSASILFSTTKRARLCVSR